MAWQITAPNCDMRVASHGGTRPPCNGKSALPDRFAISGRWGRFSKYASSKLTVCQKTRSFGILMRPWTQRKDCKSIMSRGLQIVEIVPHYVRKLQHLSIDLPLRSCHVSNEKSRLVRDSIDIARAAISAYSPARRRRLNSNRRPSLVCLPLIVPL